MRFMNQSLSLLLIAGCACAPCHAQTFFDPYVSPVGQWTEKGEFYNHPGKMIRWVSKRMVREIEPPKMHNPFTTGPLVQVFRNGMGGKSYYLDGHLWFSGWDGKREVLFQRIDQAWREVAAVPSPDRKRRAHLVPLRNGRFLAFSPRDPELKPDQPNPFFHGTYARNEKGDLSPRTLESMPDRNWFKDPNLLRMLLGLQASTVVEDHFVLCCPEYGQFWIFSLEDGRLQRTVDLYGGKAAKLLAGRSVPRMVTQFQPQKDGTLLISARDGAVLEQLSELVRKTEATNRQVMGGHLSNEQLVDAARFVEQQWLELLMQVPHQQWFELDPVTGSVRRRNPAPVGAQDLLPPLNPEAASKTFWRVDAQGRVSYTQSDFRYGQMPCR